ncbi:ABC transporter ATP-binding protein [Bacillus horti]|uniref:ATP-binding cassette subfamily B protein n=1 Tax=Caldalkalibacillus horti TaxID=77523 RepID=A0ABT9VXT9_9BACI|nr:ABC transporter transmembrane domain-containing protein [Bacillus horti]MDQ0165792.1 ATP-binding cassette subfamily B protein [Bacillus horti]
MFSIFKKLGWFFKQHKKRYITAISLLIFVSVLDIIPPKLIGDAIDYIISGNMTSERLTELLLFYGGLLITSYVVTYVWMYQLFGGAFLVERIMRSRLMRHLINMTPTFYEKNRTGDLMARATNDLKAISMTAGFGILTLIDSTVFMAAIIVTMVVLINWKLTLAALIPLPIMAFLINKYGKKIHDRFMKAQSAFGDMNDNVLESIAGVRVNRAFVQEKADVERFKNMTNDVYNKNIEVAKIDSLFEPSIKVLVGFSYIIGLGYGAYLIFQNEITIGELVSFNVYLGMLVWPMFAIGELINVMQRGNASLERVQETLAYEQDVQDHPEPKYVSVPQTIEFKNVSFRYPSAHEDQLKEISFTLDRGQTLGVVGKTGSGKTTLLKQFIREYPLDRGEIVISNASLDRIPIDRVLSWVGYVPQEQILFSKTVQENIVFGKDEATEQDVQRALVQASFEQDIQLLPEGLNTLVGEKGVALSGGQKQRVSIARALLVNPEILILDDAMSAVDGKTEAKIMSHLRQEREGKTTLISTHRLTTVKHADWIIVLDDGKIVEEGTHDQLMHLEGWYKTQYEKQQAESSKEVM